MFREDNEESFNETLQYLEYLASFWNAEAVSKIRQERLSKSDDRFASDEEFENQIMNRTFKDDIVKAISESHKNTNLEDNGKAGRERRIPKDLSKIRRLFEGS